MIFILHGEDIDAAYHRMSQILFKYPQYTKIRLTQNSGISQFYQEVFSSDFFQTKKIIICENLLEKNVVKLKDLKNIPKDLPVIFWEQKFLPSTKTSKLQSLASIEYFKLKNNVYKFLDSISPRLEYSLEQFLKLDKNDNSNLIWHLSYRILLLICAKLEIKTQEAQQILGKNIADWQWEIATRQSKLFDLKKLLNLYQGLLKLDHMLKSGLTNLRETDLIPILLLKYLKV